jgi:hypothetical protein
MAAPSDEDRTMAKINFDFKQFMMQKGEKVALGVAGGLTLILLLSHMGSYFAKEGPKDKAAKLEKENNQVESLLKTNKPPDSDVTAANNLSEKSLSFYQNKADAWRFQPSEYFVTSARKDQRRLQPSLLLPVEGSATVVLSQLRTYVFNTKDDKLYIKVLLGGSGAPIGAVQQEVSNIVNRAGRGPGGPSQGRGPRNFAQGDGRLMAPNSNQFIEQPPNGAKSEFVELDKLHEKEGITKMPESIYPLRQAIIVAAFPYKAQIAEFRSKLRDIQSDRELLTEPSFEELVDADGNKVQDAPTLESFRFLGVVVERRSVDHLGRPLDTTIGDDGWQELKIADKFKPLLLRSNLRTEPDDVLKIKVKDKDVEMPIEKIAFPGLVMPRLLQVQEGKYPQVELSLQKLKDSLIKMADEEAKITGARVGTVRSIQSQLDDFPLFGGDDRSRTDPNRPSPGPGVRPPGPGMQPRGRSGIEANRGLGGLTDDKIILPDYCLVRVIDVTVRPGESYEYRLRVRMANPNYKHEDVVNPKYAEDKELRPSDPANQWFKVPGFISVPTELHYYALDQKDNVEKDQYKGAYARDAVKKADQTVLQIQRYLENAAPTRGDNVPVGEWVVAERVIVGRGEQIDRSVQVKVPIWSEDEEKFRISITRGTGPTDPPKAGINLPMIGVLGRPAVLVDFSETDMNYKRGGTDVVKDRPAQEVLIMDPWGRLMAHNVNVDANDATRKKRLDAWRARIDDVEHPKDAPMGTTPTTPSPGGPRNPFGYPAGPRPGGRAPGG